MEPTSIPQRELRNDSARILREVAEGREFIVTVRGRPVARLAPVDTVGDSPSMRRRFVPYEDALDILRQCHSDPELRAELRETFDDSWRA